MSMRAADEKTEILLTELVEGTLPSTRRAELEAYLAAHPKEKEVIDQLLEHRSTLRNLPHEAAPPDIHDSIQSQLERSVLLENLAEIQSPPRASRWFRSQAVTLAALLVLSTGVFATVYFVVAPPREKSVEVASTPSHVIAPESKAASPSDGDAAHLATRDTPLTAPTRAEAPAVRSSPLIDNSAKLLAAAPPHAPTPDLPTATLDSLIPTRRVVIYTDDPMATRARVEQLLRSGGWNYLATPPVNVANFAQSQSAQLQLQVPELQSDLQVPREGSVHAERRQRSRAIQIPPTGEPTTQPSTREVLTLSTRPPESEVSSSMLLVRVEANQADALAAALPKLATDHSTDLQLGPSSAPALPPAASAGSLPGGQRGEESAEARQEGGLHGKPESSATTQPSDPADSNRKSRGATTQTTSQVLNLLVDIRFNPSTIPPEPAADATSSPPTTTKAPATQPSGAAGHP